MNIPRAHLLGNLCFFAGLASIVVSIAVWFLYKGVDPAQSERLAIFVGLWAPTFIILSSRLSPRPATVRAL
jgi:hypothetical protein